MNSMGELAGLGWEHIEIGHEISEENLRVIDDYKQSLSLGLRYIHERQQMENDVRKMDQRRALAKRLRKLK